jgi:peptidoglycan/xylan/chitin deacetylase (PgdA/CDA1 family)
MYHEVLPDSIKFPSWTVVRETDFRDQMEFVQRYFNILTIDDLIDNYTRNKQNRKPSALITFDDGYKGNLDTVLPIMEKLKIPFIVYVSTKGVMTQKLYWYDKVISFLLASDEIEIKLTIEKDNISYRLPLGDEKLRWKIIQEVLQKIKDFPAIDRESIAENIIVGYCEEQSPLKFLTETDLQTLSESPYVTIGSHTHGHELLDQLSMAEAKKSIIEASSNIKRIIGLTPKHFSYPNGNYNKDTKLLVTDLNFKSAVTTKTRLWNINDDPLIIPRVGIGRFETNKSFIAKLAGY